MNEMPIRDDFLPKSRWPSWLTICLVLLTPFLLGGFYYIYFSHAYLHSHSEFLSQEKNENSGNDGFYKVSYPTHQKVYFFRATRGDEFFSIYTYLDVDVKTFQALGELYGKDKDNVYFVWPKFGQVKTITGAEPSTFTALSPYYGKDSHSVYYGQTALPGVSSLDFKFADSVDSFHGKRFIITSSNLFFGTEVVHAVRNGTYVISANQVGIIPCKNKKPFEKTDQQKYFEKQHANFSFSNDPYYTCDLTETGRDISVTIDLPTYQILEHRFSDIVMYAKDKNYVYFLDTLNCDDRCNSLHVIEGADPNSFRMERGKDNQYDGIDLNGVYKNGCKQYAEGGYLLSRVEGSYLDQGRCTYK